MAKAQPSPSFMQDLNFIKYKIDQLDHKEVLGRNPLLEVTASIFGDLELLLQEDAANQNNRYDKIARGSKLGRYTVTPLPTPEQREAAKLFNSVVTKRNKYVFSWNGHRRFNKNPRSKRGQRLRGAIEIYDQLLKEIVDLAQLPMPGTYPAYQPNALDWET
jgi:hypothetical protein